MSFYNKEILTSDNKFLNGNFQLIACAGSGKTEFISERIALQIEQKIAKPDEIVAFTFTEKASEELKFRVRSKIKELLGRQPDIGDMYIGTIHAFAFKILQEFIPIYRGYDMLDDVGRLAFLSSIKSDIDIQYLQNSLESRFRKPWGRTKENWTFSVFINDLDKFIEEGWDVDEVATSESFKNAYNVYLQKMEEKHFLDFSSIQRIAVDTLKNNPQVLQHVRNQFKFFTVDEYQDVNQIQEELIQLVSGKQNVCVVGDDDQSIYQWRGADVNNILTFQSRYPDVSVHKLEINRRSHDRIVLVGKEMIERNNPRLQKSIKDKGLTSDEGDLYKLTFGTQAEECEWIVQKIKQLVGKEYEENGQIRKLEYSDFAVQFRSIANAAQPYIDALNEAGIPIVYSGVGGLFATLEIRIILQIFEYISKIDNGIDYDDAFLQNIHQSLPAPFSIPENTFISGIKSIEDWARNQNRLSIQAMYGLVLELLGLSDPKFHEDKHEVLLYNLGRFSTAVTEYEISREYITYVGIKAFLWFIRLHAERSYDSGPTDATAHLIDAVQILTMHGTKGLGFPVVFLPGNHNPRTNNRATPSWIDTSKVDLSRYDNTEQDERRLYYVGVTRAKKYLFVTYSRVKIGNTKATRVKDLFNELNDNLFLTTQIADPTTRKPCNIKGVSEEARFPTSYSEMAYYLSCGYDYKMRFLYGFNPGIVQALGFGKQVHNVINLLYDEFEKSGKIPSRRKVAEIVEANFYMRYASSDLAERLKVSAFKSIERYVKMWEQDFSLCVKTERPFELEFDNALIAGAIDMIKRESDTGTSLEVIDFKTGKAEYDLMEKYELQLQLYTIAAKEALGMDIQNAQVHFLDAAKNERMQIGTTEHALETAREQISYAIGGITQMDFKRDARNDKKCGACDWKAFCPKRKGYKTK